MSNENDYSTIYRILVATRIEIASLETAPLYGQGGKCCLLYPSSENLHKYRNKKVSRGRRSIRRQRYAIQPYDTVRLEGKTYITSGFHNKGTRLLIPVNGKSKSVAISKVRGVCHAGAWIQII